VPQTVSVVGVHQNVEGAVLSHREIRLAFFPSNEFYFFRATGSDGATCAKEAWISSLSQRFALRWLPFSPPQQMKTMKWLFQRHES
jgi:hypothetical protein